MKITEHRTKEILNWLDDKAADHALLFEEMTLFRDAASLVRQLQADEQAAWLAGMDEGRDQGRGKDHAHPPPIAPVGVEGLPRYGFPDGNEPRPVPCADGYWTPWHLVQQPAAVEAKDAEIETLKVEVAAQRTRADAMAGEAIKHEARAERLAEALQKLAAHIRPTCSVLWDEAQAALRDHDQEVGNG